MNGYPVSWNQTNHQKSAGRTGPGLPAPGGLIQKIYEVDPLTCPKCSGKMKVISVIEDQDVIKKILQRFTGLWQADKSSNTWDYGR